MHKYFFPTQDSFLTNADNLSAKNFGLTEILKVGAITDYAATIIPTTSASYVNEAVNSINNLLAFTGYITGSFLGTANNFTGSISGSNTSFNTSNFTGSINNTSSSFSGSIVSSSVIGVINGYLQTLDTHTTLIGHVQNLNGCLSGSITGYGQINTPSNAIVTDLTAYRAILNFDYTAISNSIVKNNITDPTFNLNLKVCDARELPLNYTIYAFAVSQSWDAGIGYLSDGGSDLGVSWTYRNGVGNSTWNNSTSSIHSQVSLSDSASLDGGGTWYSSSICSQNFGTVTSDIKMDVTPIVKLWLSGSIPPQGIILVASAEVTSSEAGFIIDYFSQNTNTIYAPYLDLGWSSFVFITSSIETGSVNIQSVSASISGQTTTGSFFTTPPAIAGIFSASIGLQIDSYGTSSGIVFGYGDTGNIANLPILGGISGLLTTASFIVTSSCGNTYTAQLLTASFVDGNWSGSTFSGYYADNELWHSTLSGSYPNIFLSNSSLTLDNITGYTGASSYYKGTVSNEYWSGNVVGQLFTYSTGSASFSGFFTDGLFNGSAINLQFVGNIYTSSIMYTSSINYVYNQILPVDVTSPFVINVSDLNSTYQIGNVITVYVASTEKYPQKTFDVKPQFIQFSEPHYLPSSSYYGIRDITTNEMVVDFDDYTQISCNYPVGNYFNLDTNCLSTEREYQILIKIVNGSDIYTIDTGKKFKIVR